MAPDFDSGSGKIMKMHKSWIIGVMALFVGVGCSDSSLPKPVPTLTAGQKYNVLQSISMGQFPKPGELIPDAPAEYEEQCLSFIKTIPNDYVKDWVLVPEDYQNPNGYKIKVFYYGKIQPGVTPIVFFNGGPGGNSHSSFNVLTKTKTGFSKWDKGTSFIYVDQRGTGCSDAYPEGKTPAVIRRLANYGSHEIVLDSEVIRQNLFGNKPWKIFGQSYGAHIVHRYLVDAPHGIVSAHAHANTITSDPVERFANRLLSQKRIFENYFQQYQDDRAKVESLMKTLTSDMCYVDTETKKKVCGYGPLANLTSFLGWAPKWSNLHMWINYMWNEKGFNESAYQEFLSVYEFSGDIPGYNREIASAVISFVDRNFYTTCEETFKRIQSRGTSIDSLFVNECMGVTQLPEEDLGADVEALIQALPTRHLSNDMLKLSLERNMQTPFYLYSGDMDCYVPKESFAEEISVAGKLLKYTSFKGSGHDGFYTEPLVWENLIR